ncbi:MAG: hypothetical protein R6U27_10455 [Desulfobacterales bacterium]
MADSKTYREALDYVEQIIEEWIKTATELGGPRSTIQRMTLDLDWPENRQEIALHPSLCLSF